MTLTEAENLLALSEDELWVALGSQVTRGAGPRDSKFLRTVAKAWFKSQQVRFQEILCPHAELRDINAAARPSLIVAAICDVLAPHIELPQAATAATLIFLYGLDRLCEPSDEA